MKSHSVLEVSGPHVVVSAFSKRVVPDGDKNEDDDVDDSFAITIHELNP